MGQGLSIFSYLKFCQVFSTPPMNMWWIPPSEHSHLKSPWVSKISWPCCQHHNSGGPKCQVLCMVASCLGVLSPTWVWFTHVMAALLSAHFWCTHLLVDSNLWKIMKWCKSSFHAAMPNNLALVEHSTNGMPSTGPAPWASTFWFPINTKPKDTVSLPLKNDPWVPIFRIMFLSRHPFSMHSPPGVNLSCISSHLVCSGSLFT